MDFTLGVFVAGAIASFILAVVAVWRNPRSVAHLSFGAGMALLAAEAICNGLSIHAAEPAPMLRWQCFRQMLLGFVPAPWLIFSACFGRGNYRESLKQWRLPLLFAFLVPAVILLGFGDLLSRGVFFEQSTHIWRVLLTTPGILLNIVFLLTSILVLLNLERTFRGSLGTMRWRIKYLVLGVGALSVCRIYTSSQTVLYSSVDLSLARLDGVVLLIACGLIALSLSRSVAFNADIYPSHTVLYKSLTIILAGIYLLLVGVLAEVVSIFGTESTALPVPALLLLLALVGLTVLLLSERIRQRTKRFVSRHFHRPLYDYRQVWATFTEETTSLMDEFELCRKVSHWLADTFQFLSVTIWLTNEAKDHLIFGASTSIPKATLDDPGQAAGGDTEIIRAVTQMPLPVDFEVDPDRWAELLRRRNPGYFPTKGGDRACVPLLARGELLGLVVVGDRVSGLPFSTEDLDLLKSIGDQVAAGLLNIDLSKRLAQAKQMEAFQTMSAFFVHDLKNTTFTLSLLLQNLKEHFDDPGFREDALRAVSRSVERMNHMIERLTVLRHEIKIKPVAADLNEVVDAALSSLGGTVPANLVRSPQSIPKVAMDPEQIQKVIVNLVLNAADATGNAGQIRIETGQRDDWLALTVTDNGCGMSREFIQKSLFRPFQTTKKKGIGIGMFHSKMIVEAHQGRIEVESQPGRGTTFRVLLPV